MGIEDGIGCAEDGEAEAKKMRASYRGRGMWCEEQLQTGSGGGLFVVGEGKEQFLQ